MRFIRASTVVAAMAITSSSTAEERKLDPEDGRIHWMIASALGYCARHDLYVGGAGVCGEWLSTGLWVKTRGFDFIVEAGVGSTVLVHRRDLNVDARGGGDYLFLRKLVGAEIGPLGIFRTGPELRLSAPFGAVEVRPQLAGELGVRTSKVSLGVRLILGLDATRVRFDEAISGSAFIYETMLFFRVSP